MKISLPASWDELSTDELEYLASLCIEANASIQEVKVKMALYVMQACVISANPEYLRIDIRGRKVVLSVAKLADIADNFSFLFSDGRLCPGLTRSPYPKLKLNRRTYTAIDDLFSDALYEDYMNIIIFSDEMRSYPDAKAKLMASLYRVDHFKVFEGLHDEKQMVLLWWVEGCMRYIGKMFPVLFSAPEEKVDNSKEISMLSSQMKVVDSLSSGDVTKKESVRKSRLYDALYSMCYAIENQNQTS